MRAFDPSASAELEAAARETSAAAQAAAGERARLQVEAEERWARVAAIERGAQAVLATELEQVLEARGRAESLLTGGGRDSLLALRGAAQRLAVRHESAQRLLGELRGQLVEARNRPSGASRRRNSGLAADAADASARAAARERDDLPGSRGSGSGTPSRRSNIHSRSARACRLPRGRWPRRESGSCCSWSRPTRAAELAVAAALGHRASAVVADDLRRGLELIDRARALGPRPGPCAGRPRPGRARSRAAGRRVGRVTDLECAGGDRGRDRLGPEPGELWFAGETAEAVLLELEARSHELHAEVEGLMGSAADAERGAPTPRLKPHVSRPRRSSRSPTCGACVTATPAHLERLAAGAERLDETLRVAAAAAARLEAPLAERTTRFAEDLRLDAVA